MDESVHPSAAQLAKAGEWYVRAISTNDVTQGRCFGFSGSPGCGKTMVARGIYQFVQQSGIDIMFTQKLHHWACMWVDWPNVAELDDEDDFKDLRQEMQKASFVVIDDIGSESDRFKNGVSASRLRRILSIIENKWVVVTSNLNLSELLECYDARSADRLRAFQWIDVGSVPSYRPHLKGA